MKSAIIIVIVIVVIGIGGFYLAGSGGTTTTVVDDETGEVVKKRTLGKAPNWTLKDYEGNEVSFSDFEGKVAVVNTWAVWCPFCRDELSDFAELQKEFGDEIVVIAIDRNESLKVAKGFTDGIGITDDLIFLLDPGDTFYRSIGAFSMPETIFVDTEGDIIVQKRGPMELDEMRRLVNSVLGS